MTDQTTTTETVELVYLVERADAPGEARRLSSGTRQVALDEVPGFAVERAKDTRAGHSYYTGPLTVSVWEKRPDEHFRQPAPDHAANYSFPEGWTGDGACGWDDCKHGCKED